MQLGPNFFFYMDVSIIAALQERRIVYLVYIHTRKPCIRFWFTRFRLLTELIGDSTHTPFFVTK